jgi:hypothetical protein
MIELKRFGGAPNGYPFAPLHHPFKKISCGEQDYWQLSTSKIISAGRATPIKVN